MYLVRSEIIKKKNLEKVYVIDANTKVSDDNVTYIIWRYCWSTSRVSPVSAFYLDK